MQNARNLKVTAKGRNGYFKLEDFNVWSYKGEYWLDFYSKSPLTRACLCRLSGSKRNLQSLLRRLRRELNEISKPERTPENA